MPELPEAAAHVWEFFKELSERRSNGFGVSPITWEALEAWQRARRLRLRTYELDWLLDLDRVFFRARAKEAKP